MTARIVIVALLATAVLAGALLYYLQIYGFYREVLAAESGYVQLATPEDGQSLVPFSDFRGIDSVSSPIRYRACFALGLSPEEVAATAQPYPEATPLVAPPWFDCFDAAAIGAALAAGEARAYLGIPDVTWGVDRVVAVFPDGRGAAWHQLNRCGEAVFGGDPLPDGCTPPPVETSELEPDAGLDPGPDPAGAPPPAAPPQPEP